MAEYLSNIVMIMQRYWRVFLITGVGNTLLLSAITVVFGVLAGIMLCLARMSKVKVLNWLVEAVVGFVRGTPMLLQLYIAYFFLPRLFPFITDFISVTIALIVNSACYQSEIFRSGIQAVDRGQTEAARSLGLNATQTMTRIVLPQAVKNILPALGNEFIMLVKDTSLASTFFVGELMTSYLIVKGNTYLTMECLTIIAIVYFLLTFTLSKILGIFEGRMKAHD